MGLINLYNGIDNEHKTIKGNGKLKDILPDYNFENCIILKAGEKVSADYEVTEEDVLFLRTVPSAVSSTAVAIAVTSAVVVAGVVVGAVAYNKNKELQEQLEKAQNTANNNINKLPFLKGAKNTSALGKTIPYIMGEMYHTPYLLSNGFYSISGNNGEVQKWNAILISGYNDQRLKSVSIGSIKVADYDETATSQDGIKAINSGIYQTENNDCKIEVCTNGELLLDGLNQKVISQVYEAEVKHDHNSEAEPLIEQCAENVMRVEVCIRFDGLREYSSDENKYIAREVEVIPYWSNNPEAENPTWNAFNFDVINDGSATYTWVILEGQDITNAINDGYFKAQTTHVQTGMSSYTDVTTFTSNSSDYRVTLNGSLIDNPSWTFEHKQASVLAGNKIVRNTDKTCRFVATKTFTASESYGKNISIKLVKTTPKAEANTSETCILQYIQTWCYDAVTSTSEVLKPCYPLGNPYRDQTTRIGLSMIANGSTQNVLDEINIITTGIARTWNGTTWSSGKSPTRNPASWILELLTSNKHSKSQYKDSEINLTSLGAVYTYCNINNFYCDGIITEGKKKSDIIQSILSSIFVDMVLDEDGLLSFVIDKKEETPVALLNSQSITSITYAKSFEREVTGQKVTYTDRKNWSVATEYFMRNGSTTYDQEKDTLTELALDYVTTHEHAYKVSQRQQRLKALQPKTITANVGLEGDYYPLYSTVLLQVDRFKQGLYSSVIEKINVNEKKLTLRDYIYTNENYRYGIIIQAQNNNGRKLIYSEITVNEDNPREVTLISSVSLAGTIKPELYNQVSIGLLNTDGTFTSITNTMKITGIKPASNNGWELELKDYTPSIYEYGAIPEYRSNLTNRPTTKREIEAVKPIDYEGLKWEIEGKIDSVEEELSERIDDITTSETVCSMDLSAVTLEIDDEGFTQTVQTFSTNIKLKRSEIALPFTVGDLDIPEGWTAVLDGSKLTFTVGEGVQVNAGFIKIPVFYTQIVSSEPFVDENNVPFVDEDGEEFLDVVYGTEGTEWDLYFNYIGNGYGRYLGAFSNLSEIPAYTNVSSYFVWAGENRKASQLAYEGFFRQGQTYKYIGTGKTWSWEADTNSGHMQSALSDVLAIANADLKNNNSTVWAYLDHLTTNSIYCDMLVANEGFIDKLSSKIITSELVTTSGLSEALENYETKDGLTEELKKYIESNKLFTDGSSTLKDGTLDLDSIKNIAIRDGKTLIAGGYINTNVLDVETITAGLVKSNEIDADFIQAIDGVFDNITVTGKVDATRGLGLSHRVEFDNDGTYSVLQKTLEIYNEHWGETKYINCQGQIILKQYMYMTVLSARRLRRGHSDDFILEGLGFLGNSTTPYRMYLVLGYISGAPSGNGYWNYYRYGYTLENRIDINGYNGKSLTEDKVQISGVLYF